MARVNIDGKLWKDPRARRLAAALGWSMRELVGTLAAVWDVAYDTKSEIMAAEDVDLVAERDGFAAAMVRAKLAEDHTTCPAADPGHVRLCGVLERIKYLLGQAERGRAGGKARAERALSERSADAEPTPSVGQANASDSSERQANAKRTSSDGQAVPKPPPSLPLAPDLALAPDLPPDSEALSPARSAEPMSQPEPQPAAAAPPTPAPQPVIRDQHQLVLTNAWAYHRERFLALQADGIDRNAIAPNGIPMGTAENALSERIGQFRAKGVSYDEIAVKLKQRIDVGEAECRRENHTKWFGPMTAWAHGQFWRALETTVEQASEPRPTVAARASPRAAIGPVKPPASHPVSAGLENF